jgi:hypothetical protein
MGVMYIYLFDGCVWNGFTSISMTRVCGMVYIYLWHVRVCGFTSISMTRVCGIVLHLSLWHVCVWHGFTSISDMCVWHGFTSISCGLHLSSAIPKSDKCRASKQAECCVCSSCARFRIQIWWKEEIMMSICVYLCWCEANNCQCIYWWRICLNTSIGRLLGTESYIMRIHCRHSKMCKFTFFRFVLRTRYIRIPVVSLFSFTCIFVSLLINSYAS